MQVIVIFHRWFRKIHNKQVFKYWFPVSMWVLFTEKILPVHFLEPSFGHSLLLNILLTAKFIFFFERKKEWYIFIHHSIAIKNLLRFKQYKSFHLCFLSVSGSMLASSLFTMLSGPPCLPTVQVFKDSQRLYWGH